MVQYGMLQDIPYKFAVYSQSHAADYWTATGSCAVEKVVCGVLRGVVCVCVVCVVCVECGVYGVSVVCI